jgi:hypothetical protein
MADLVFGLAKTAVNATVSMTKSAIEDEKKLKKSVQRDLMLISDEFEMMHAFLNVVSNERAKDDDDMSRTWVRQVRDMALDVEDSIECVLQLDDDNKPNCWWRTLLPSCVLLPQEPGAAALGDAVAGIELLKARIEAMGPRNTRYIQIQQIGDAAACKYQQCKPVAVGELLHQQAALADSKTGSDILFEARNSAKICPVDLVKLIDNKEQALRVVSMVEWDTIRAYLPDRNNGSCIVVHTQQAEIAGLCVGHSHRVCELEQFSADHSVCVFFNKVCSVQHPVQLVSRKLFSFTLFASCFGHHRGICLITSINPGTCSSMMCFPNSR